MPDKQAHGSGGHEYSRDVVTTVVADAVVGKLFPQRQVLDNFTLLINEYIQGNPTAFPHKGMNLQFFYTFDLMVKVFENPGDYGLVNLTAPCLANREVFIEGIG